MKRNANPYPTLAEEEPEKSPEPADAQPDEGNEQQAPPAPGDGDGDAEAPPQAGPAKPKKPALRKGDFVFAPYVYGKDAIFQIVRPGPKLSFVVGDVFSEPTPVLTADLKPLQDHVSADPTAALKAARRHVIRTARTVTANEAGILRLQMLQEGLERLKPAVEAASIAGGLVTYLALKGIVDAVLKERTSSREQRTDDYAYQSELFFNYD